LVGDSTGAFNPEAINAVTISVSCVVAGELALPFEEEE
jgi:hypothetical protein